MYVFRDVELSMFEMGMLAITVAGLALYGFYKLMNRDY